MTMTITQIKKEASKKGLEIKPAKSVLLNGKKCWEVGICKVLYTKQQLISAYINCVLF